MLLPLQSMATGIPTVDIANLGPTTQTAISNLKQQLQLAKQYAKQIEDYKAQLQQIKELQEQLRTAKDTFGSITGIRDMAKILNNPLIQEQRKNLPSEWQNSFGDLQNLATDAVRGAYDIEHTKNSARIFGYLDKNTLNRAFLASENLLGRAERRAANIVNADSLATTTYKTAGQQMQQVEDWIGQVDKANDLKASMDLNNRMLGEMLANQNLIIQVLSANTKLGTSADEDHLAASISDKVQSEVNLRW